MNKLNKYLNTFILALSIFLVGSWLWATPYPGGGAGLSTLSEDSGITTVSGHFRNDQAGTDNLGTTSLYFNDIFVGTSLEHGGDTNTRIDFFPDEMYFYAGRTTTMFKISEGSQDLIEISGGGEDTDFAYKTTASATAFYCDDGLEECTFSIGMGFEAPAGGILTVTLDGATTINPLTNNFILLCTDAETLATITNAPPGAIYTFNHFDSDCTITDDEDNSANSIDLLGTTTNLVGADDLVLSLLFNGTSWNEVTRTQN